MTTSSTQYNNYLVSMNNPELFLNKAYFVKSKSGRLTDDYIIGRELGKGAYGTVFAARSRVNGKVRAIKQIKKASLKCPVQFYNQIEILKKVDHPNIIKIYETFEDDLNYYVITDLCEGGELFDRLIKKGCFNECEAREIFRQMVYAIKYCHGQKIAHRDLKPENFLLMDPLTNSLKLIDFGLSFEWKQDMRAELKAKGGNKLIGTSYYIAPEILKGDYDERCDIWSLGVILYILVTAVPPFDGENDRQILESVKKGYYTFQIPEMARVSNQLKDLICKILQPEERRYTIDQIFRHPWMKIATNKATTSVNYEKLHKFSTYCPLKRFAISNIAAQFAGKEIQDLGLLFREMDLDMDGFITTRQLKFALERQHEHIPLVILEQLLRYIDTDKNGKINYCEFITCCAEMSLVMKEENVRQIFNDLDHDHDGKISECELRNGFSINNRTVDEETIRRIIKQCDRDGDGQIDFNEFVAVVANI